MPLADKEAKRTVPADEYRNYPAYAYTTQVAVVEVDAKTGKVNVLKIIAAHDCGRAINPQKIEGQIEGSCLQGQGYALSESYPPGQRENRLPARLATSRCRPSWMRRRFEASSSKTRNPMAPSGPRESLRWPQCPLPRPS